MKQTNARTKMAVVIGSVRQGRVGATVAAWVVEQAKEHGTFDVDVVDLVDVDIPLSLPAESPKAAGENYPRPESLRAVTATLAAADAFVVVTPEYNHSYPASLKALVDWHFTQWAAKPVAFVSYGGIASGRHAVLHLENVFTELHAVTIRDGLAFPNYYATWEDGRPLDPNAQDFAKTVFVHLDWWARHLRTARETEPYPS
ncbi:NADPH-dependent FMN reductase [Rhodococcus sp. 27YEA15]|uniref:NADPH-dependent FMN reductase n=1 Tax=Rhodococcus sp. 27YEA15 TaxID=3156259 RepID=UPI003C7B393E